MRHLKLFEDFVKEGIVKRVAVNKGRAKSLISEADRKMNSLSEQLENGLYARMALLDLILNK